MCTVLVMFLCWSFYAHFVLEMRISEYWKNIVKREYGGFTKDQILVAGSIGLVYFLRIARGVMTRD